MKFNILPILLPALLAASPLSEGWKQLYANNPDSALSLFKSVKKESLSEKAAAIRGELAVHAYLYGDDNSGDNSLASKTAELFRIDSDPVMLAAHLGYLVGWSRDGITAADKLILKELYRATSMSTCISPMINEVIISKEMARGKIKPAGKLNANTGIIKQWQMIGPFENSAGSGFQTVFAPEISLLSDTVVIGKDRNQVKWNPIIATTPDPWIWLNNHAEGSDAVYYFATSINSAIEQPAMISFGASGNFKIFHNGTAIIQDSLFRNTGVNSFLTKTTLLKGVNTFLVKIGYEEEKANFTFALLNTDYKPFTTTTPLTELVDRREPMAITGTSSAIMVDSVQSVLEQRIAADSSDLEAQASLVSFLLIQDQSREAEEILRKNIARYPESGWLQAQLGNVLARQGRMTEAGLVFRKAFELSPEGNTQWRYELNRINNENNLDALQKFLDGSAAHHKNSADWISSRMSLYAQSGKTAQAMALLDTLAENFPENPSVALLRHSIYAEAGQIVDARKVLERILKIDPYNQMITYSLGEYLTKTGNTSDALSLYIDEITRRPESPRPYYLAASLFAAHKQYADALPYVEKVLTLTPNSSLAYRLKGQILQQLGKQNEALETYKKAVDVTVDDFVAWESQRELEGKPSWQALAPIPPVDSILPEALAWADSLGEAVTVLSYYDDIIRYPSKASRTRTFFVVHLADRKSIEEWQEYVINSGRISGLTVLQALTLKKDGRRIPADRDQNHLVFKSLEAGDNVLVEYTQEERTGAGMTGMIYGEQRLTSTIPAYRQHLRFITPVNDTLPWRSSGIVPTPTNTINDGFQITEFVSNKKIGVSKDELFLPDDFETNSKVIYSDFKSWNEIARWYYNLSAPKGERNELIQSVADSLFAGVTNTREKVLRTHHYITKNIAYSFVPFRQSGWIPQSTSEILATRIGDCKDMALLGRTLLRLGGVQAELVLVNTGLSDYIDGAFIGPNFDHAILAAPIDGVLKFIDLTASNAALDALPVQDQGAMALLVTDSSMAPIMLPRESAEDRRIEREMNIVLKEDGSVQIALDSKKYSVFATEMRNSYRFSSNRDRISYMQNLLQEENKAITVDSLTFEQLDTLGESLSYRTVYHMDNGVSLGVNTALFRVPFADQISSSQFPAIASRTNPIDLKPYYRWNSSQVSRVVITYPKSWKLTGKLQDRKYTQGNSFYQLKVTQKDTTIIFDREALFQFNGIFTVDQFKPIHQFMSEIFLADNQELIFQK